MGEPPSEGFEASCLLSARGATVAEIIDLLDRRWSKKDTGPGGSHGPRGWAWFWRSSATEFSPIERGRLAEPPATAHATTRPADEIARGIEALEANDEDASLFVAGAASAG